MPNVAPTQKASDAAAHAESSQQAVSLSHFRLPSYRSSYLERFHPYVRTRARRKVDLMQTVDYRYDHGVPYRPSFALSVVEEEDEEVVNNLAALVPAAEGQESVQRHNKLRRLGIVELVIDLALAMRRRFRKS
ncbi:uncharacterized protein FIBRA_07644 [Fibroporia radiculosa]|uniref:Uncharacterized protein n=1 Tax=Fibroporia radiculosa TaxID=599839 RepID=J4I122_9APHY|nr:uncharacterized protein FIBRA_07644 [Fibroporia radiculosa]CCM05427.1 predicted protein [Fibroporia radiculosa]